MVWPVRPDPPFLYPSVRFPMPVLTCVPIPPETTPCREHRAPTQSTTRTLLESLIRRALGLVTTTLIAFALTGLLPTGSAMTFLSAAVGTVVLVPHERA